MDQSTYHPSTIVTKETNLQMSLSNKSSCWSIYFINALLYFSAF